MQRGQGEPTKRELAGLGEESVGHCCGAYKRCERRRHQEGVDRDKGCHSELEYKGSPKCGRASPTPRR